MDAEISCIGWRNRFVKFRGIAALALALSLCMTAGAKTTRLFEGDDLVQAVADAEAGDVLELDDSTYLPTNVIRIGKALTIRGAGRTKTSISGAASAGKAFVITDGGVRIESLTIRDYTKGNTASYSVAEGGFINMTGGTLSDLIVSNNVSNSGNIYGISVTMHGEGLVTNCLFQANKQTNGGGNGYGGGVYMTAGEVVDCRFVDNTMSHYGDCGGGVYATGGKVLRCYFRGNGASNGTYSNVHGTGGCGIYVNGPAVVDRCMVVSNNMSGVYVKGGGTLRNCVITGQRTNSSSSTWPAGVYIKNGSMYNCTICGNESLAEGSGVQMEAGTAINNIIYGNGTVANVTVAAGCTFNTNLVNVLPGVGTGNSDADPLFRDQANLDFTLTDLSPALEGGATVPSVTTDYAGVARPQGGAYDIGAYERVLESGQIICSIVIDQSSWGPGTDPSVRARVIGASSGTEISYAWYLDGALVPGQTGETATFSGAGTGSHKVGLVVTVGGSARPKVEKDGAFTVCPTEVYVDAAGGNVPPYEKPGNAAHSLEDALSAVWTASDVTSVVHIAAGNYPVGSKILLKTPFRIVGAGRALTSVDGANCTGKAFEITCDDVRIEKLAICNYRNGVGSDEATGGFINMFAATLSDLVISNNCTSEGNVRGVSLCMRGNGLVTNCLFLANRQTNSGNSGYGGVYMLAGTVVDCRFVDNTMAHYGDHGGGVYAKGGAIFRCYFRGNGANDANWGDIHNTGGCGIYLDGAAVVDRCTVVSNFMNGVYITGGGTVKNCVITGHKTNSSSTTWPAGVYIKNGNLYNCTIYGNESPAEGSGLQMDAGVAINNIIYGNGDIANASVASGCTFHHNVVNVLPDVGSDNLANDPKLNDPAALDFTLPANSIAVNRGATIESVETDLVGTERPQSTAYDIGAYERVFAPGEVVVTISSAKSNWPIGSSPTVEANVIGAGEGDTFTYKWFLDGAEVTGATERTVTFAGAGCGSHAVKLQMTMNGKVLPDVEEANLFKVSPTEVYVDVNGGDVSPYETSANAAHSLNDAISALWLSSDVTSVVHIAAGDYPVTQQILLSSSCRILGAGREVTRIDASGAPTYLSVIKMGAGSEVRDLTVHGAKGGVDGAIIKMTGGIVENCQFTNIAMTAGCGSVNVADGVVRNCVFKDSLSKNSGGWIKGSAVYISGGLVEDCDISNHHCDWYGYIGSGIYLTGGTARRCRVWNCGCRCWSYGSAGACGGNAFYIDGANALVESCVALSNIVCAVYLNKGTMRNCLIAGNGYEPVTTPGNAAEAPGGVYLTDNGGGRLYNCTVMDNTNLVTAAISDIGLKGGTAVNNIALIVRVDAGTAATNLFGEVVAFADAAKGDYHLTSAAKNCINRGDRLDYTAQSVDLDGKPRITNYGTGRRVRQSARPDLGCYESPYGVTGLSIVVK